MNPPFNDPTRQRASPDVARALAHAGPRSLLVPWIKAAARLVRARGTLTLIWRADGLADVLAALVPAFGALAVTPVHPVPTSRRSVSSSRCQRQPGPAGAVAAARAGRRFRAADGGSRGGAARRPGVGRSTADGNAHDCVSGRARWLCNCPAAGTKTSVRAFLRLAATAEVRCGRNRGNEGQQDKDLYFHCRSPSHPGLLATLRSKKRSNG